MKNETGNKKESFKRKFFKYFRSFGLAEQSAFVVQNLAVLLGAGMSVTNAFESALEEAKSPRLKSALREVIADVQDGVSISKALSRASIVSPYVLSLIKLGEQSGRLSENLKIASIHYEKERVFRSRIRAALMYSVFVVTVAIVVGVGISWFILPQVASFFQEIDAPLPALTRGIILVGAILRDYGVLIVPLFLLVVLAIVYFLFSFPKTRFIGHSILFHIPAIGRLIKETEVSRFGFIVGSMLQAGVPLKYIFELLPSTTTFRNYKKLYEYIDTKIIEGHTFKEIFESYKPTNKLLPLSARQMIITSEKSGTLSETYESIGTIFEAKVDSTSRAIPTFLEPMLLILVGGMVVVLALGILMPIYKLGLYLQ